jgi:2-polyprenyl-3-methyl-5-hydroxy-6-metoxy-1,4-benzoquinol methylase
MSALDTIPEFDTGLPGSRFEEVPCYACGSGRREHLTLAEDDLTGKAGVYRFVTCQDCGLAYLNPRLKAEHILEFYGDDYIAHSQRKTWGMLQPLYEYAVGGIDRNKEKLVRRFAPLGPGRKLLDVGCGGGSFLQRMRERTGADTVGLDFKDLSALPALKGSRFRCGLLHRQDFGEEKFDLITMWHFLEHDYDPLASLAAARRLLNKDGVLMIEVPRLDSRTRKLFGNRWPGLQAPQHTALYSRESLLRIVEKAGFDVIEYLPYGAFPAYFYLFTGLAFKILKGKGLNLRRLLVPYLLGQILASPVMLFEKKLDLAMQIVVCRRRA